MEPVVVQYEDTNKKTRWGYITKQTLKDLEMLRELQAEIAKGGADNRKMNKFKELLVVDALVYLADGTTGDAKLEHLTIVKALAEASDRRTHLSVVPSLPPPPPEPPENDLIKEGEDKMVPAKVLEDEKEE